MLLNPSPDEQIPPDDKDYSNNENHVIILGNTIYDRNDANSTYDKDEHFLLETVSGTCLIHAVSPLRCNASVILIEVEVLSAPGELAIPFSSFLSAEPSISHLESITQACLAENSIQSDSRPSCPAGEVSNAKYSVVSSIMINNTVGIIPCILAFAPQYMLQYR